MTPDAMNFMRGNLAALKTQETFAGKKLSGVLMHLAGEDELRLGRNAVAVADLEEHLIEAR